MSFVKIQHIASFSSEDKSFPAENLLKTGEYKKWICAKGGEKQASVVLQFAKASKIHSIDIGNEGSAFIEVLVGRLSDSEQNYQVLLVASSFMSPVEARNGTNTNRVRMFGTDKFSKGVMDEKWDRAKVVCTQPFNKASQYGLAFIKFHSSEPQAKDAKEDAETESQRLGAFTLRDDSSESSLAPGSLFSRAKESTPTPIAMKGALEIRAASAAAEVGLLEKTTLAKTSSSTVPPKRKTETQDDAKPDSKKTKHTPAKVQKPPSKTPFTEKKKRSNEKLASPEQLDKGSRNTTEPTTLFHQLLSGVIFVLSGFQNPQRSDLRDKALEMGAKYRQDWNDDCTHLICAFPNTPKFQQVKSARGKIVAKQWILDCHKRKAALPWRHYKLKGKDESSSDSDRDETSLQPASKEPTKKVTTPRSADSEKSAQKLLKKVSVDPDNYYGSSTDVDSSPPGGRGDVDESDTDDEIQRAMLGNDRKKVLSPLPDTSQMVFPELPDFFHGNGFFLYGQFEEKERRLLLRYIIAFNGKVEDYMSDKVAYVITSSNWDDNFDEALASNSNIIFAKPKWIHACATKQKVVPHQPYIVVPKKHLIFFSRCN